MSLPPGAIPAATEKDLLPPNVKGSHIERLADPIMWVWCWIAYRLVMALPLRMTAGLLGYAGYYGYHQKGMPWRWSERHR